MLMARPQPLPASVARPVVAERSRCTIRLSRRGWLSIALAWLLLGIVQHHPGTRSAVADDLDYERQWPHWRGPLANGVAPHANPPLHWDQNTHVRWKVKIPGEGSATPIVWGNRIFILTAVPTDRRPEKQPEAHPDARTQPPETLFQFVVQCYERSTGQKLWERVACEAVPHEGRHTTNSYASGSPTTDGQRLYVSFGSRGIYCYTLDGDLLWQRDLGDLRTRRGWGEAVTPVVSGEYLLINWDNEDDSKLIALDSATGDIRWQVARDEATTWNTPLVVDHQGQTQVIVNGQNRVRSYALETGEELWQCGGQTLNPIPSPLAADGVAYCVSGYRGAAAYAIPLDVRGDVTDSDKILWSFNSSTPYVPSPILYGDQFYFTRANNGILTSVDKRNGTVRFGPARVSGIDNLYASPVAAAGRIYLVSREGTTVVLEHGPELKVLATNVLDEPIDASPVLVGNELILRSISHLYCISSE